MLRLKDFPQVSQVKGMSLVWAMEQAPWLSQLWGTPSALGPASQPLSPSLRARQSSHTSVEALVVL